MYQWPLRCVDSGVAPWLNISLARGHAQLLQARGMTSAARRSTKLHHSSTFAISVVARMVSACSRCLFRPSVLMTLHTLELVLRSDPNFPLYDPLNRLYHHFYQDHLSEDQGGNGQGPVIGHAVSADMVQWA